MVPDEATQKFYNIFYPGYLGEVITLINEGQRFSYYTSAETAMKVIRNEELWFRNATAMNDFSEINYGLSLIQNVFSGTEGEKFRQEVESILPDTINMANNLLSAWEKDWRLETYIACVSIHDAKEDNWGRLSMWRAYGNTALIVKNTPMVANTDLLEVFSFPVLYLSEQSLADYLSKVTHEITIQHDYLKSLGQETLVSYIKEMLFRIAIATKHPGFEEEREWRLYYRPNEKESPAMAPQIVTLNGVPQKIYKLRLSNEPENGLFGADIPSLLDKIIIGPTEFPYVSYEAFVSVLKEHGVEDAHKKVVISDIPLRVG